MNDGLAPLLILILTLIILICGCTISQQGPPYTSPITTQTSTVATIVPTSTAMIPSQTPTQDGSAIRMQFDSAWRQIQVIYDTYTEKRNKFTTSETDVSNTGDINYIRQTLIPDAITAYQDIKKNLSNISISDYNLNKEKTILISICDYKIKYFEGLNAAYQGIVLEPSNVVKSKDAYKNAKYLFQDTIDIINVMGVGIAPLPSEKEPPYSQKYWDYIYNDKERAGELLAWTDDSISRLTAL